MARSSGLTGGMAPDAFIQLEGVDPIIEALDKLGAITARRIVRPAVNKALTPINKAAKGKLRPGHGRDTGALSHLLNRAGLKLFTSSGGPVGLGVYSDKLVSAFQQTSQVSCGKLGGAGEYNPKYRVGHCGLCSAALVFRQLLANSLAFERR